jgi:hypothetical protein
VSINSRVRTTSEAFMGAAKVPPHSRDSQPTQCPYIANPRLLAFWILLFLRKKKTIFVSVASESSECWPLEKP